jgi:hypothetical protein
MFCMVLTINSVNWLVYASEINTFPLRHLKGQRNSVLEELMHIQFSNTKLKLHTFSVLTCVSDIAHCSTTPTISYRFQAPHKYRIWSSVSRHCVIIPLVTIFRLNQLLLSSEGKTKSVGTT